MTKNNQTFIKDFKVSDIIPCPRNPRINDCAVEPVINSIKNNGNIDPVEIDENNMLLTGHTRLKAFKKLGIKTTNVLKVTGLSDKQKDSYRVQHNKTNEFAQWDLEMLKEDFSIPELKEFKFTDEDLNLNTEPVDDYDDKSNENGFEDLQADGTLKLQFIQKDLNFLIECLNKIRVGNQSNESIIYSLAEKEVKNL